MNRQHETPPQQVKNNHARHQAARHRPYALDAADDDQSHQDRQHRAADPGGNAKISVSDISHIPGLEHGGGDRVNQQGDAEQPARRPSDARPAGAQFRQPLGDHPHGAAVGGAAGIDIAVQHGQGDFRQLESHANHAHHPHPEDRARSAQGHGDGDAADVAQSHGGGQRC